MQYRANKKIINPRFLLYSFLSSDLQNQFRMHDGTGSVVSHIRVPDCLKFEINLPPLHLQNSIVSILGTLDDKIQLNHQINQTLEQMAQAIFKSWFVDFEPVKAKMEAKKRWHALQPGNETASPVCYAEQPQPLPDLETCMNLAAMQAISGKTPEQLARMEREQPDQYARLRATAELFPSAMQPSELGDIPEGWRVGTLSDIAVLANKRIPTQVLTTDTYVSTENMLENRRGICEASTLPSSATVPSFEKGQILISNIRPYFKKIWLANKSGGRSPDVLGFEARDKNTNEFVFNLLYQDRFFDYMMLTSKGAKMPRGDKKAIMNFHLALPSDELMQKFSERVRSFYKISSVNNNESKFLALLRDTLLPKLLSGEITVPEAEAQLPRTGEVQA